MAGGRASAQKNRKWKKWAGPAKMEKVGEGKIFRFRKIFRGSANYIRVYTLARGGRGNLEKNFSKFRGKMGKMGNFRHFRELGAESRPMAIQNRAGEK